MQMINRALELLYSLSSLHIRQGRQLGKLASELSNCSGVELLPYHNLGEGKRMQLGRNDAFSAETPSAEYMQQLRSIAAAFGKPVL